MMEQRALRAFCIQVTASYNLMWQLGIISLIRIHIGRNGDEGYLWSQDITSRPMPLTVDKVSLFQNPPFDLMSALGVLADECGDDFDIFSWWQRGSFRDLFKILWTLPVGPVLRARLICTSSPSNSATKTPRTCAAWRTNSTDGL